MMQMWMWFGYNVGEFMFAGLQVTTRWAFALTWIAMFFVAVLFEASKVYLARVQRDAHKKLYPFRSDERRNLLGDREHGMAPTTSRNAGSQPITFWTFFRVRTAVHVHQTMVFLVHNVVGYLLMLAVMVYNVQLLLAVVFGLMLGYFLFGPKLTRLQMQCFSSNRRRREIICTPECDDTDRCNTEKCSFDICEGKLCKKMDGMEMQMRDTTLGTMEAPGRDNTLNSRQPMLSPKQAAYFPRQAVLSQRTTPARVLQKSYAIRYKPRHAGSVPLPHPIRPLYEHNVGPFASCREEPQYPRQPPHSPNSPGSCQCRSPRRPY